VRWRRGFAGLAAASAAAFALTCASIQREEYERAHPRWAAFPTLGADVHATLVGLFDSGQEPAKVSLNEIALFRTDRAPWLEIPLDGLPPPGELATGDYALAARRFCRVWGDEVVVVGANEWFLFRDGALRAYDARSYGRRCAYHPAIEPARGADVDRERALRAWVDANLPAEELPRVVHYARGIAYADALRAGDAAAWLASGDAAPDIDPGVRIHTLRIGRSVSAGGEQLPKEFDAASARAILVRAIATLRRTPD